MNINRYNYEEFFLLYVDNELTKAERDEVDAFVHDNPDLEEELRMLRQSMLRPDAAIQFLGKESLLKPESASIVNETNYEEFFLLYVDDELNAIERREVEEFAATKPQFRQELNLLLQTKLEPGHEVVFPDKSLLYKQPGKERPVIFITWQRIVAVAAMLLLALGIFWIMNTGKAPGKQESIARTEQSKEQQQSSGAVEKKSGVQTPVVKAPQIALQDDERKKNDKPENSTGRYNEPEKRQKQLAYEQPKVHQQSNNSYETETTPGAAEVAKAEKNASSNNSTGLNVNAVKTTQPLVQTVAYVPYQEEDDNVYIANTTVDKKNKLRGLFRKVTRVFEKTTNLPAVEEKGILIGNLEIALK
jgi:anti-sigma factor RsiW